MSLWSFSPRLSGIETDLDEREPNCSFSGLKKHGESGVSFAWQKNYAFTMSDLPSLLIGFLFIGFVVLIVKTFFDGVKQEEERRKKSTRRKMPRGNWYHGDR
jgi:hypothetical protein